MLRALTIRVAFLTIAGLATSLAAIAAASHKPPPGLTETVSSEDPSAGFAQDDIRGSTWTASYLRTMTLLSVASDPPPLEGVQLSFSLPAYRLVSRVTTTYQGVTTHEIVVAYVRADQQRTDSWDEATPDDVTTIISGKGDPIICSAASAAGAYCFVEKLAAPPPSSPGGNTFASTVTQSGPNPFGAADSVVQPDPFVDSSPPSTVQREILGERAVCIEPGQNEAVEMCMTADLIPLTVSFEGAGMSMRSEAISLTREVTDSDFLPPYPVLDTPPDDGSNSGRIYLTLSPAQQ